MVEASKMWIKLCRITPKWTTIFIIFSQYLSIPHKHYWVEFYKMIFYCHSHFAEGNTRLYSSFFTWSLAIQAKTCNFTPLKSIGDVYVTVGQNWMLLGEHQVSNLFPSPLLSLSPWQTLDTLTAIPSLKLLATTSRHILVILHHFGSRQFLTSQAFCCRKRQEAKEHWLMFYYAIHLRHCCSQERIW